MCCLDLNYLEETADGPDVTIAAFPSSERLVYIEVCDTFVCIVPSYLSCKPYSFNILYLQMDAKLHADNLTKVMEILKQGSKQVHTILDRVVKRQYHH